MPEGLQDIKYRAELPLCCTSVARGHAPRPPGGRGGSYKDFKRQFEAKAQAGQRGPIDQSGGTILEGRDTSSATPPVTQLSLK